MSCASKSPLNKRSQRDKFSAALQTCPCCGRYVAKTHRILSKEEAIGQKRIFKELVMSIFSRNKKLEYRSVGSFANNTDHTMTISLEMNCEEVILEPGHVVELLAAGSDECFPVTINYYEHGLQIYPNMDTPTWLLRFQDKEILPGYPTRLSDFEQS